jgi:hypothetical protein
MRRLERRDGEKREAAQDDGGDRERGAHEASIG